MISGGFAQERTGNTLTLERRTAEGMNVSHFPIFLLFPCVLMRTSCASIADTRYGLLKQSYDKNRNVCRILD